MQVQMDQVQPVRMIFNLFCRMFHSTNRESCTHAGLLIWQMRQMLRRRLPGLSLYQGSGPSLPCFLLA